MNTNPMGYTRAATIASDLTGIPAATILQHISREGLATANILRAIILTKQIALRIHTAAA